jgi:uncharacterized protein GlcG (DUF336 family)
MTRRPTAPDASSPRRLESANAGTHQPTERAADDTDIIMAPTVRLAAAQRAVGAAVAEAERLAVDVCIAAADSAGHLLAFARMDHAPLLCVQLAQDKAYSVSSFGGLPTDEWWRLLESEPALLHGIVKTDRLVPLVCEGRTVGAIGVSGGSSEQDVRIAEAGAAAVS